MALLGDRVKSKMKKNTSHPLIIKKYENRRLYNTLTSQYINQDQVAQLVRDGYDVRVVDATSGEDLTRLILAQIVLEDAKTPDSVFPLDVLRQMIVASGRATQESGLRYMKAMLEIYQNAYRALPPLNPFEFLQPRWAQPSKEADTSPTGATARGSGTQQEDHGPATEGTKTDAVQVDELKKRIEELESLLPKRRGKKTALRKSGKSRRKA
jgi:polyhydroxyalkanoate synthesis repressor PhaR